MKKVLFIIVACSLLVNISNLCTAGETFTLTSPVTVVNQAVGGEITGYTIVPGPEPRFVINFIWVDSEGNQVGVPQAREWTGTDFTDIFGGGLGSTLQDRIHTKIETKYGVDIE